MHDSKLEDEKSVSKKIAWSPGMYSGSDTKQDSTSIQNQPVPPGGPEFLFP